MVIMELLIYKKVNIIFTNNTKFEKFAKNP